jgi:hypothetical protein
MMLLRVAVGLENHRSLFDLCGTTNGIDTLNANGSEGKSNRPNESDVALSSTFQLYIIVYGSFFSP